MPQRERRGGTDSRVMVPSSPPGALRRRYRCAGACLGLQRLLLGVGVQAAAEHAGPHVSWLILAPETKWSKGGSRVSAPISQNKEPLLLGLLPGMGTC